MTSFKKTLAVFTVLLCLNFYLPSIALEAAVTTNKYPDYGYIYLGKDKFEKFNRRVFVFNSALNKYALKPIHTIWASVMPKYGIERIQCATNNIEYPIRLASTLLQKDFKASKTETVRFLTNTTIGIGGLYDPAKKIFKIEPVSENMEQALTKCKVKQGPYIVVPILSSSSPRGICGKILDTGLNPSSYVASPILAMVKAGIMVNRTSYMQPIVKMIESTYADPYEISRKLYGLESHIKASNLDRKDFFEQCVQSEEEKISETDTRIVSVTNQVIQGSAHTDSIVLPEMKNNSQNDNLKADIVLKDYNPQNPVIDSMRTALFDLPEINKSIWNELSVWNRCFCKKIKTSSVKIDDSKAEKYNFRYIMQKNSSSPVAIIYPSIGEGINSYHSSVLAKIFYDKGYSVIIQGSHFQWEFVKSMPSEYKPGLPARDAYYLKQVTSKIIAKLEDKYNHSFGNRVVLGTSFGAMTTLFLANEESKNNTLNITKYISISPPIELLYAMNQIDKNSEEWQKSPDTLKDKVALTAAKVINITQMKNAPDKKIDTLPFSEEEAKLITGFIMHQKLSDLILTLEHTNTCKKCDIYKDINNMNFNDYAQKYLLSEKSKNIDELDEEISLYSITEYLKNNNNYTIYHTLDDYLVNTNQLKQLKKLSGEKTVLISNGAHLGFLYRQEFLEDLKKKITLKNDAVALQAQKEN